MQPTAALITTVILVTAIQFGRACSDPLLTTNTSMDVLKARYREVKTAAQGNSARNASCAPTDHGRGAARLFTSKQACFLYPNLRSQYDIPCLGPLITRYEALPKTKRRIQTFRDGKALTVAVQIVGARTNKTVLICIPGVMSDATVFRFLVGALANAYDFWLIDPPGCGDSEAPNPRDLGPSGYSPAALADRELQAIAACLQQYPNNARILIVAHSLGGLVALRAFGDPQLRALHSHVLSRTAGLVMLASGDVFMSQVSPTLVSRADLSGLIVRVGNGLGVVPEAVAEYLAGGFYASHCLPREEVDHAVAVISNAGTREAFKAMLRQALAFDPRTRRPNFFEMMAQEQWYANIDVPCELIWGKCDQTVPVYIGYMLEHQLPDARLTVIPDCKHAPMLECPAECARLVRLADHQIASRTLARNPVAATLR